MVGEGQPVLVGYDGSELSKAAVRHAADLFPGRLIVLVTVWEPGLAAMAPDSLWPPGPKAIDAIEATDRAGSEHASRVAGDGAELARSLGLAAEPDVADTLIDLARERSAAVVVVGSHGMSGLRSRFLGGVSRKLIEHCDRPVLVIRGDRPN